MRHVYLPAGFREPPRLELARIVAEREARWLQALREGRYETTWHRVGDVEHAEPIKVDGLHVCVRERTAREAAAILGARLPTKAEAIAVFRRGPYVEPVKVTFRDGPMRLQTSASDEAIYLFSEALDAYPCGLIPNAGKFWLDDGGAPTNFGWSDPNGPYQIAPGLMGWQPPGKRHSAEHVDCSQTLRLVRDVGATRRPKSLTPVPVPAAPPRTFSGDRGPRVKAWQEWLLADARRRGIPNPLPRYGADGDHGGETERATAAYFAAHDADEVYPPPSTEPAPPPSGVELERPRLEDLITHRVHARNLTAAGRDLAGIWWIVLHSIEGEATDNVALATARYFGGLQAPQASAHLLLGPNYVVEGVPLEHVAWAAPGGNRNGIQIEMAGRAQFTDWLSPTDGLPVLLNAARVVAALCRETGIPIVRRTPEEMVQQSVMPSSGLRGIVTHDTVRRAIALARAQGRRIAPWFANGAWKSTTHVDPGMHGDKRWPWDRFLLEVEAA